MQPCAISVIKGDITTLDVDAIINSANRSLLGGGGVDRAIHRAAGRELLAECIELCGCPVGESRLTKGYALPARHVIHTVGPVWLGGASDEVETLRRAVTSALDIARDMKFETVAFCCISRVSACRSSFFVRRMRLSSTSAMVFHSIHITFSVPFP